MANGLLDLIAKPPTIDVLGAVQAGQEQAALRQQRAAEQAQAQRQRAIEQQVNDLFAERFTGKLADLARMSSDEALAFAQATGIDITHKGRMAHWLGTAQTLDSLMKEAGPDAALQFLNQEREIFQDLIPTPRMDAFAEKIATDPANAAADLAAVVEAGKQRGFLKDPETKTLAKDAILVDTSGNLLAENINQLRDKFTRSRFDSVNNNVTKFLDNAVNIRSAANALDKLSETATSADQFAAIISFIKVLDPTSVVSESEGRNLVASGGLSDQFLGQLQRLAGGGQLRGGALRKLVNTAKRLADSRMESASENVNLFLDSFGDELPKKDRENLLKRIPAPLLSTVGAAGPRFLGFE